MKKIITILLILIGISAKAQTSTGPDSTMIVRISEIEVFPEYLKEYLEFAHNVGATSVKEEPGVICIYPMQQLRDDCQIRILEIYASQEAYQHHIKTEHFQTYKQGTLHMVKSLDLVDMRQMAPECLPLIFKKAYEPQSTVYVTRDLSPESIVNIYHKLGHPASGRVALKISTGESEETGYIRPDVLKPLIDDINKVEGNKVTIVECNTAYAGTRNTSEAHWKEIEKRGFLNVAPVDIMDEEGDMRIPVSDTTHIKYNLVGTHLQNYDFMINLAHFKGHQMAGMGGVLKNASIGVASSHGKAYIHTAGITEDPDELWNHVDNQDGFVESMASAAQAVHNYIADYGILASDDPVALDQACYDIVCQIHNDEHNDNRPLLERIANQHGTHIMEWGEQIGLGSRSYKLVSID